MSKLVKSFDMLGREHMGTEWPGGDAIVAELQKAMATTSITGMSDATPLRLENLDGTMTSVLFEEAHLKMFQSIPRVPSAQEVYQWIRRNSYGSTRGAVGFAQGGAPKGSTSKWTRLNITNKYLGVRGGYTHQLLTTGQMGGIFTDPVAEENRNRTLELLEKIERRIVFSDKTILDAAGNEVHYDGLLKQITAGDATAYIDLQGAPMDFERLEEGALRLVTTGKLLNFSNLKSFWTPSALTDLAKLKYQAERIILPGGQAAPEGYRPGTPLEGFRTQHGYIAFDESIFLDAPVPGGAPLAVAETSAPAAPTTVTATPTGTNGLQDAGTYYYSVASFNDDGESVPAAPVSAAPTAGQRVDVVVTKVTGPPAATGYRVYRGIKSDGSDALWIADLAQPGGATVTYADANQQIPGTGWGIVLNLRPQDIALAQMAPLIKFPLAIVNTTIEFLLLLYHVLVVKAAERTIVFKNIGRRS